MAALDTAAPHIECYYIAVVGLQAQAVDQALDWTSETATCTVAEVLRMEGQGISRVRNPAGEMERLDASCAVKESHRQPCGRCTVC